MAGVRFILQGKVATLIG